MDTPGGFTQTQRIRRDLDARLAARAKRTEIPRDHNAELVGDALLLLGAVAFLVFATGFIVWYYA